MMMTVLWQLADSDVWNDVMLLLEGKICSWKLPLVSDLVEDCEAKGWT